MKSNLVCLTEGEKDDLTLMNANLFPNSGFAIACTTSFDGAWKPGQSPKWLDSYGPYFTGKQVIMSKTMIQQERLRRIHRRPD